ncbi:hypothetical protein TKK_0014437 [Trichogramma kaykai]
MYERWTIQPIARQEDYRRSNWPPSHFGGMALLGFSTRKQRGPASIVPSSESAQVMVAHQAPPPAVTSCLPNLSVFSSFSTMAHHFGGDVKAVTAGEKLPKRSRLRALHPFIGTGGLLRVGGRLQNAPLTYDEKHPIILPGHCLIVRRLIEQAHRDTLHGGPQLMRSHLGHMFWILRVPRVIPAVCRDCVRCARFRATAMEQQMGPLPAVRVTPGRPFQVTGLDYAGPLPILFSKGRKAPSTKGYVAIFICMIVRAVHVEVVSDLTTSAFLAAFSRFCARRGRPAVLYSDNGTTFKGASREPHELFSKSSPLLESASNRLQKRGTVWKFIPPRVPHFGGLWEASMQSFKYHFRRRLLRGMRDLFWSRWRREVLLQMQQRSKWLTARESLQSGDMVLLKDDLCSPSSWPLARVEQVHPGSDGLVRVATIKTASSTFTRPIVKLIKLPTDAQAEEFYCRLNEKEKNE